jgi:carbon storage regulator
MLVLTRKVGEAVLIGKFGEIEVRVMSLLEGQVRIGFSAPRDIPIHREEVSDRILNEKLLEQLKILNKDE